MRAFSKIERGMVVGGEVESTSGSELAASNRWPMLRAIDLDDVRGG